MEKIEPKFYDGAKLLSLKDINGETPEIYLCTTNRSGGKTTYFSRLLVKKFKEKGEKFCLVYRYNYELDKCAEKFFDDIRRLFFPADTMESKRQASGIFHELFLNGKSCGYAISLNSADQLKKYSHFFSDTERMLFDEFQSETNHYCANEVSKLISIHTSIARGNGKQVRYVPIYMLSNTVTLLNPYYTELGISNRLREETKFLRGEGFVLEQGFVESAALAQKSSAFNRAFAGNKYTSYSSQNVYLNDVSTFVEKLRGHSNYYLTLRYNGNDYAIREFPDLGLIYCDDRADASFLLRISVTTDDHQVNYVMLKNNDFLISRLRYFFEHGCFRFKNLQCKEVVLKALSY